MNKSDKTAKTIIEKFGFKDKDLTTPEHDKMVLWTYNNWNKIILELEILKEGDTYEKNSFHKIIEYPLKRNGYNIGFIDLLIQLVKNGTKKIRYEIEYYEKHHKLIWFEIKPEIKSIGEIIREINFYRSNLEWNNKEKDGYQDFFIIVTKTKGLKELFLEQEILVYEFEEGVKN